MPSFFANQENAVPLDRQGDPLVVLYSHVDFAVMVEEIDRWGFRPSKVKGGDHPIPQSL